MTTGGGREGREAKTQRLVRGGLYTCPLGDAAPQWGQGRASFLRFWEDVGGGCHPAYPVGFRHALRKSAPLEAVSHPLPRERSLR